ncbi:MULTISPECIES: PepSY-associated TM helix domain-containing protein [Paraburkholderia]|uniref:Peptidase n=1 Tax=Paraburkholderia podalyriae TaxID=1938811 RepID=A0ABR7PPT5_9BURK|nr:PepSY-associated TM helix domain-containing protein [Paraburkholderia podalyriae]MBC8748292.1 peptidase [Paraburkholderia podalyriae]
MSVLDTLDIQPPAAGEHDAQEARRLDGDERKSRRQRSRRASVIKWLRNVHGWVGLWGAALGLLFGATGFFLNHRGGPLRVLTGEPQVSVMQVPLPQPAPQTPRELAKWLEQELKIGGSPGRMQKEPEHPVAWGDRSVVQPEHWQLNFASPKQNTSVEYWVGNNTVTVKRSANTLLAMLTNMHKGVGLSVGWVLLIDTLAGSLILLSLTGVLLWTELNRRKTVGLLLVVGSIAAAVVLGTM